MHSRTKESNDGIERVVSSHSIEDRNFKQVALAAEEALQEQWAAQWRDAINIKKTRIPGQSDDEYSVHIEFDGTVNNNLTEEYEGELGVCRITGFTGDGEIQLGVTLNPEAIENESEKPRPPLMH